MLLNQATGDIIKEIVDKFPNWVFSIIGLGAIALFFYLSYLLSNGARKISSVLDKENNIKEMQEKIRELEVEKKFNSDLASLYNTSMDNIGAYVKAFSEIRLNKEEKDTWEKRADLLNLLSRMVDSLATDVKFDPGEKHRCGLWMYQHDERNLVLTHASSGFPSSYINNRKLHVDNSIAGRAYRLKRTIQESDVQNSLEWVRNSTSTSKYKAILAIPIDDFGVVTIDAINPMKPEMETIAETYSKLFDLIIVESIKLFTGEDDFEEIDLSDYGINLNDSEEEDGEGDEGSIARRGA